MPAIPLAPMLAQATTRAAEYEEADALNRIVDHLQLGPTFAQTRWQEWAWLLVMIFVGLAVGKIAQWLAKQAAARVRRRGWEIQATFFECFDGPLQVAALAIGLLAGILPIYNASAPPVQGVIAAALRLLAVIAVGWFLYNLVDVVSAALLRLTERSQSELAKQIVPLVRKTLRVFLIVLIVLFAAQFVFGADITAWLAGLGIAGLAVSLAAQDSLKNLFGSITVLLDRPFQVGDRVIIDGHDGPVEEIGFRSTKLRKLTGELVTIPNSKVVDASVINVQRRPTIPRIFSLTVTYDTPAEKVRNAVQIVRDILAEPEMTANFDMEKQPPRVYFDAFNADSLNIKVYYWFRPATDWWAYNDHSQKFNDKVLTRFNEAGIDFAFPTQTLMLASDPKRRLRMSNEDGDASGSSPSPGTPGEGRGEGSRG